MKKSEEIYVIEDILALNKILGKIYDGSYVENGFLSRSANDELGAMIETLISKMETKIDEW